MKHLKKFESVDRIVLDEDKFISDVHLLIKKFGEMELYLEFIDANETVFGTLYKKFISKYGTTPSEINQELISDLALLFYHLNYFYFGKGNEKGIVLRKEIEILRDKVIDQYNDSKKEMDKYNL